MSITPSEHNNDTGSGEPLHVEHGFVQLGTSPQPWTLTGAPSPKSMPCIRDAHGRAVAFINRGIHSADNGKLLVNAPRLCEALQKLLAEAEEYDFDPGPARDLALQVLKDIES